MPTGSKFYIVTCSYSSRLFLCTLVPTQVKDQGCNWRMIRNGIKYYYDLFYSCFLQPQFSSTPASVNVPVSQRQVLGSLASQENIRQQVDLTRFPELCKLATYPGSVFFSLLHERKSPDEATSLTWYQPRSPPPTQLSFACLLAYCKRQKAGRGL